MSINIKKSFQLGNVQLVSGKFYLLKYKAFKMDPEPLILFMNVHWGVHDSTKHMHSYIQGLNFHYLDISKRLNVFQRWIEINKNGKYADKNFTKFYSQIKTAIPNIDFAVRRYLIMPPGLITDIRPMSYDFLLQYFSDPAKLVQSTWNIADKIYLAGKMRAMKIEIKR